MFIKSFWSTAFELRSSYTERNLRSLLFFLFVSFLVFVCVSNNIVYFCLLYVLRCKVSFLSPFIFFFVFFSFSFSFLFPILFSFFFRLQILTPFLQIQRRPFSSVHWFGVPEVFFTKLVAATKGNEKIVKLLLARGASVNDLVLGETALISASRQNHEFQTTWQLLDRRQNIEFLNNLLEAHSALCVGF